MQTNVLIVGGGLSGLHTAYELHRRGISFLLVEARDRFGGRILSYNVNRPKYSSAQADFDLGPSWFWPGQTSMQSLIRELDLDNDVFMQMGVGDALYEDNQGNIQCGISGVSMAGAYRMRGGIQQIVAKLSEKIPTEYLINNAAVTQVEYQQKNMVTTIVCDGLPKEITSKYVVLALPPRVALASIKFTPQFTQKRTDELNAVATWMAGHAKFVAVYNKKFWIDEGFSGDVISHLGPLQEIHDASSESGELSALFGFIGVQAQYRKNKQDELRAMALAQLTRLFGESASKPIEVHLKDWAFDINTSTPYDQEILKFHSTNNIVTATENSWGNQLSWSGSESADNSNGFLEGALGASLKTVSYFTS